MKFFFFLCALVAAVAASYGNANTFDAPQRFLGRNRVVDDFDVPRHFRGHRWHRRGHRGNRFGRPSSSDSHSGESDSRSDEFDGFFYLPPITGTAVNTGNAAQDSASSSYNSASNDAPAATAYGSAAQDPAQGY